MPIVTAEGFGNTKKRLFECSLSFLDMLGFIYGRPNRHQ